MTKLIKSPEELIKFHQEQMTGCEQAFVEHAYKCGEILKEKRRILGHGKFDEWVKEHWHKSKRTVNDYIALTGLKPVQILECTSIREAKSLLPKPPNAQHAAHLKPEDTEKTDKPPATADAEQQEVTYRHCGFEYEDAAEMEDPPDGYEDVEDDELVMPPLAVAARYQVRQFSIVTVSQWIKDHATEADAEGIRALLDELFPQKQARPAKRGGFQPPTVQEVAEFVLEYLIVGVDSEAFVDHFSSNGWKVGGKAAMKDWKAAVRNWGRNSRNNIPPDNAHAGPPKLTAKEQTRHSIRCDIFDTDREWAVNATDEEIEAAIDAKL